MKKNMKKNAIAVITAATLVFSLGGCGAKTSEEAGTNTEATETAEGTGTENESVETAEAQERDGSVAAIVGSWKLDKVLISEEEGAAAEEVSEEDHASLYAEKDSLYTFNEDGTGTLTMSAGGDTAESEITWEDADDCYEVTSDGITEFYVYDVVDDTLLRQIFESDPYMEIQFIYVRQ